MFNKDDSIFFMSLCSSLLLFVHDRLFTETLWFDISVDERGERIHDENGKRHALRIASQFRMITVSKPMATP